jgi:hypothetical protein
VVVVGFFEFSAARIGSVVSHQSVEFEKLF